jgi:hypothetical protein
MLVIITKIIRGQDALSLIHSPTRRTSLPAPPLRRASPRRRRRPGKGSRCLARDPADDLHLLPPLLEILPARRPPSPPALLLKTPPTRQPPSPPALLLEIPPARRPPPRRARGEDAAGEEAPPWPGAAYDAGEKARPMAGGSMKPTSSSSAGSLQRRLRPPAPPSNLFPRPPNADHDGPHRGQGWQ